MTILEFNFGIQSKRIVIVTISTVLLGCASINFDPKPGMTYKEVNTLAWITCANSKTKMDEENISRIGLYKNTPGLFLFATKGDSKNKSNECMKEFIIFEDRIISIAQADEMAKKYSDEILLIARDNIVKVDLLNKEIAERKLRILDDFKNRNARDFRIFVDEKGNRFYAKNYQFVDIAEVSLEVQQFNERRARLDAEEQRRNIQEQNLNAQRRLKLEEEQKVQELLRQEQAKRDACLNNGPVGVCNAWNANKSVFYCDQNASSTIENLFNRHCYATDKNHVYAKVDIKNNTPNNIKDVTIRCEQFAKSGTSLRRGSEIIYDIWSPKQVKSVELKFFKHSQVASVRCIAETWK